MNKLRASLRASLNLETPKTKGRAVFMTWILIEAFTPITLNTHSSIKYLCCIKARVFCDERFSVNN